MLRTTTIHLAISALLFTAATILMCVGINDAASPSTATALAVIFLPRLAAVLLFYASWRIFTSLRHTDRRAYTSIHHAMFDEPEDTDDDSYYPESF